jgi:hypothetical protein
MATDWDKELAKIDKQLASISDEELRRAGTPAPVPAAQGGGAPKAPGTGAPVAMPARRPWGAYLKVLVALGLGVGILFWPKELYPIRCGVNLMLYMAGTGVITLAGVWSAVSTWRHRLAAGHVVSLGVTLWGLVLAAQQALPRLGYARPDLGIPTTWLCG